MTLTVVPSPSDPNIINISGNGMNFDVAVQGGRVDITAQNRNVEVWMSNTTANIRWGISSSISSSSFLDYYTAYQMHMPNEVDHSMKNTRSLTGDLFYAENFTITNNPIIQSIGLTGEYAFFGWGGKSLSNSAISRVKFGVGGEGQLVSTGLEHRCGRMIVYSSDIAYMMTVSATSHEIYKFNFSSGTATLMAEEVVNPQTHLGMSFYARGALSEEYDILIVARCKYGNNDVLVGVGELHTKAPEASYSIFGIMVYDLVNDELIQYSLVDGGNKIHNITSYGPEYIGQYQTKAIFSSYGDVDYANVVDGDQICACPLFIVDIITGNVTRIEEPAYTSPDNPEYYYHSISSAMDNAEGAFYYFTEQTLGFDTMYRVRKALAPTFSPSEVWNIMDGANDIYSLYSTPEKAFRRGFNASGEWVNIQKPDGTFITILNSDQSNFGGALDEEEGLFWTIDVTNSKLVSKSIDGAPQRDITINWGDTSPPAGCRGNMIWMLNGSCVVRLYENNWKYHYYILWPT